MNNDLLHITNEDCMNLMTRYEDNHFDLAIVDPPYGIGVGKMAFTREVKKTVTQRNGKKMHTRKKAFAPKDWDSKPPSQDYFNELKRISRDQIIFGINYMNWTGVGMGRLIWDKCVPDGMSFNSEEVAYCSLINTTTKFKLLFSGMQQAKSLSEPTTAQGNKKLNEHRIHPCQKPVLLYKWILKHYAHSDARIIDAHLGGASIAIACNDLGFDLTACELDKDYYEAGLKRIESNLAQKRLFV